jgi:hypothetical protein
MEVALVFNVIFPLVAAITTTFGTVLAMALALLLDANLFLLEAFLLPDASVNAIAAVILSVAAITVGRITRGLVAICIIDAIINAILVVVVAITLRVIPVTKFLTTILTAALAALLLAFLLLPLPETILLAVIGGRRSSLVARSIFDAVVDAVIPITARLIMVL